MLVETLKAKDVSSGSSVHNSVSPDISPYNNTEAVMKACTMLKATRLLMNVCLCRLIVAYTVIKGGQAQAFVH